MMHLPYGLIVVILLSTLAASCHGASCSGRKIFNQTEAVFSDGCKEGRYYDNNLHCEFLIEVPWANSIYLEFLSFSTELEYDVVELYSGLSISTGSLLRTFSGLGPFKPVYVAGNSALLFFTSDAAITKSGWTLHYTALQATPTPLPSQVGCAGFHNLSDPEGTLGDGSASDKYAPNNICQFLIQVPNATEIYISFTEFDTEKDIDLLEIYQGTNESGILLATFSGSTLPDPLAISGNSAFLVFDTDFTNEYGGWTLHYQAGFANPTPASSPSPSPDQCDSIQIYQSLEGYIEDGSGSQQYTNSLNCTFQISVLGAHRIFLDFVFFDVVRGDVLKIYEGAITNDADPTWDSSEQVPQNMTLYGGTHFIVFETDSRRIASGWKIHYVAAPCYGRTLTSAPAGEFGDRGVLDFPAYQTLRRCEFVVAVPYATSLVFTLSNITATLPDRSIQIFSGWNAWNESALVGDMGVSDVGKPIQVAGDTAIIVYSLCEATTSYGFWATYVAEVDTSVAPSVADEGMKCDGDELLTAPQGAFGVGGGVAGYALSSSCSWAINVTAADAIFFEFSSVWTESVYDVVQVMAANSGAARAQLSGFRSRAFVAVPDSAAIVSFAADQSVVGSGWSVRYWSAVRDPVCSALPSAAICAASAVSLEASSQASGAFERTLLLDVDKSRVVRMHTCSDGAALVNTSLALYTNCSLDPSSILLSSNATASSYCPRGAEIYVELVPATYYIHVWSTNSSAGASVELVVEDVSECQGVASAAALHTVTQLDTCATLNRFGSTVGRPLVRSFTSSDASPARIYTLTLAQPSPIRVDLCSPYTDFAASISMCHGGLALSSSGPSCLTQPIMLAGWEIGWARCSLSSISTDAVPGMWIRNSDFEPLHSAGTYLIIVAGATASDSGSFGLTFDGDASCAASAPDAIDTSSFTAALNVTQPRAEEAYVSQTIEGVYDLYPLWSNKLRPPTASYTLVLTPVNHYSEIYVFLVYSPYGALVSQGVAGRKGSFLRTLAPAAWVSQYAYDGQDMCPEYLVSFPQGTCSAASPVSVVWTLRLSSLLNAMHMESYGSSSTSPLVAFVGFRRDYSASYVYVGGEDAVELPVLGHQTLLINVVDRVNNGPFRVMAESVSVPNRLGSEYSVAICAYMFEDNVTTDSVCMDASADLDRNRSNLYLDATGAAHYYTVALQLAGDTSTPALARIYVLPMCASVDHVPQFTTCSQGLTNMTFTPAVPCASSSPTVFASVTTVACVEGAQLYGLSQVAISSDSLVVLEPVPTDSATTYPAPYDVSVSSWTSLYSLGYTSLRWIASPDLPSGLALDPLRGVISGIPSDDLDVDTYSVRVCSCRATLANCTDLAFTLRRSLEASASGYETVRLVKLEQSANSFKPDILRFVDLHVQINPSAYSVVTQGFIPEINFCRIGEDGCSVSWDDVALFALLSTLPAVSFLPDGFTSRSVEVHEAVILQWLSAGPDVLFFLADPKAAVYIVRCRPHACNILDYALAVATAKSSAAATSIPYSLDRVGDRVYGALCLATSIVIMRTSLTDHTMEIVLVQRIVVPCTAVCVQAAADSTATSAAGDSLALYVTNGPTIGAWFVNATGVQQMATQYQPALFTKVTQLSAYSRCNQPSMLQCSWLVVATSTQDQRAAVVDVLNSSGSGADVWNVATGAGRFRYNPQLRYLYIQNGVRVVIYDLSVLSSVVRKRDAVLRLAPTSMSATSSGLAYLGAVDHVYYVWALVHPYPTMLPSTVSDVLVHSGMLLRGFAIPFAQMDPATVIIMEVTAPPEEWTETSSRQPLTLAASFNVSLFTHDNREVNALSSSSIPADQLEMFMFRESAAAVNVTAVFYLGAPANTFSTNDCFLSAAQVVCDSFSAPFPFAPVPETFLADPYLFVLVVFASPFTITTADTAPARSTMIDLYVYFVVPVAPPAPALALHHRLPRFLVRDPRSRVLVAVMTTTRVKVLAYAPPHSNASEVPPRSVVELYDPYVLSKIAAVDVAGMAVSVTTSSSLILLSSASNLRLDGTGAELVDLRAWLLLPSSTAAFRVLSIGSVVGVTLSDVNSDTTRTILAISRDERFIAMAAGRTVLVWNVDAATGATTLLLRYLHSITIYEISFGILYYSDVPQIAVLDDDGFKLLSTCPTGSRFDDNLERCVACRPGYVGFDCKPCPPGFICASEGMQQEDVCPAGMVCLWYTSSLPLTPANRTMPAAPTLAYSRHAACGAQPPGEPKLADVQRPEAGWLNYTTGGHWCPPGYYCPAGVASFQASANVTTPLVCFDGYVCAEGSVYGTGSNSTDDAPVPCPAAFSCANTTDPSTMFSLPCPPGHVCPAGTTYENRYALDCAPGKYCPGGGVGPQDCPVGRSSVAGAVALSHCRRIQSDPWFQDFEVAALRMTPNDVMEIAFNISALPTAPPELCEDYIPGDDGVTLGHVSVIVLVAAPGDTANTTVHPSSSFSDLLSRYSHLDAASRPPYLVFHFSPDPVTQKDVTVYVLVRVYVDDLASRLRLINVSSRCADALSFSNHSAAAPGWPSWPNTDPASCSSLWVAVQNNPSSPATELLLTSARVLRSSGLRAYFVDNAELQLPRNLPQVAEGQDTVTLDFMLCDYTRQQATAWDRPKLNPTDVFNPGLTALDMPWLPFFSRCSLFDSRIYLSALINPQLYPSACKRDGGNGDLRCLHSLQCFYDEDVTSEDSVGRWYQAQGGDDLFYLSASASRAQSMWLDYELILAQQVDVLPCTVVGSQGSGVPRGVQVSIDTYQKRDFLEVVRCSVSFSDYADPADVQAAGSTYGLSVGVEPLGFIDLLNLFALDFWVYLVINAVIIFSVLLFFALLLLVAFLCRRKRPGGWDFWFEYAARVRHFILGALAGMATVGPPVFLASWIPRLMETGGYVEGTEVMGLYAMMFLSFGLWLLTLVLRELELLSIFFGNPRTFLNYLKYSIVAPMAHIAKHVRGASGRADSQQRRRGGLTSLATPLSDEKLLKMYRFITFVVFATVVLLVYVNMFVYPLLASKVQWWVFVLPLFDLILFYVLVYPLGIRDDFLVTAFMGACDVIHNLVCLSADTFINYMISFVVLEVVVQLLLLRILFLPRASDLLALLLSSIGCRSLAHRIAPPPLPSLRQVLWNPRQFELRNTLALAAKPSPSSAVPHPSQPDSKVSAFPAVSSPMLHVSPFNSTSLAASHRHPQAEAAVAALHPASPEHATLSSPDEPPPIELYRPPLPSPVGDSLAMALGTAAVVSSGDVRAAEDGEMSIGSSSDGGAERAARGSSYSDSLDLDIAVTFTQTNEGGFRSRTARRTLSGRTFTLAVGQTANLDAAANSLLLNATPPRHLVSPAPPLPSECDSATSLSPSLASMAPKAAPNLELAMPPRALRSSLRSRVSSRAISQRISFNASPAPGGAVAAMAVAPAAAHAEQQHLDQFAAWNAHTDWQPRRPHMAAGVSSSDVGLSVSTSPPHGPITPDVSALDTPFHNTPSASPIMAGRASSQGGEREAELAVEAKLQHGRRWISPQEELSRRIRDRVEEMQGLASSWVFLLLLAIMAAMSSSLKSPIMYDLGLKTLLYNLFFSVSFFLGKMATLPFVLGIDKYFNGWSPKVLTRDDVVQALSHLSALQDLVGVGVEWRQALLQFHACLGLMLLVLGLQMLETYAYNPLIHISALFIVLASLFVALLWELVLLAVLYATNRNHAEDLSSLLDKVGVSRVGKSLRNRSKKWGRTVIVRISSFRRTPSASSHRFTTPGFPGDLNDVIL